MNRKALTALILAIPLWASAAPDPREFPFVRALEGPAVTRATPVAAPFDAALLAEAGDTFADVRIVDDRGVEVPCAIGKVTTQKTRVVRHPVASRPVALKELPGNRIEAEFELVDPRQHADGVEIHTPLHDFVRSVSVQGRGADGAWQTLVEDGVIFDYRRYLDVRQTGVPLPSSTCTAFRLRLANASEERAQPLVHLIRQSGGRDAGAETRSEDLLSTPFRMDGVAFWRDETVIDRQDEVLREWELVPPAIVENTGDRTTECTFAPRRVPLSRLLMEGDARNFSRAIRVEIARVEGGREQWRTVSRGQVFNVDLPGFSRDERVIHFPEQRAAKLRLVIENGDNPPLGSVRVRAFGPSYQAVLLAEPGRTYRLLYGAPDMAAPVYDLEAVLAPARLGLTPASWRLGPPEPNPGYRAGYGDWKAWINSRYFLTTVIILAALGLLALLARTLKKVS